MGVIIDYAAEAIFGLLAMLIFLLLSYLAPSIKHWVSRFLDKYNLGILESVVDMAVELAEKELSGSKGEEKLKFAVEYVSLISERYGMKFSPDFIKGAIQSGWRKMDNMQRQIGEK